MQNNDKRQGAGELEAWSGRLFDRQEQGGADALERCGGLCRMEYADADDRRR